MSGTKSNVRRRNKINEVGVMLDAYKLRPFQSEHSNVLDQFAANRYAELARTNPVMVSNKTVSAALRSPVLETNLRGIFSGLNFGAVRAQLEAARIRKLNLEVVDDLNSVMLRGRPSTSSILQEGLEVIKPRTETGAVSRPFGRPVDTGRKQVHPVRFTEEQETGSSDEWNGVKPKYFLDKGS